MTEHNKKYPNQENQQEDREMPEDHSTGEDAADRTEEATVSEAEALRQELEETKDRMLRIAADADNFKKRMEREKENLVKYAGENILRELLSTVDNLERALEQAATETVDAEKKLEALIEGLELTHKGLVSTLEKFDVQPIESVGKEFNPNEHEALTMEQSDEVPQGHVAREFVKGYRFKDRLLRDAKVAVSSGPATNEEN
ncbi:protein GrpE [Desulfolithobacter dissulfuricans]|uniref:Protein GrpE n=1 Tax=Desulfolithobacter dissulfuricans TaxID=2795293 RepID=A0A915XKD9_9BACT|nr:nucleotide exchange factor GrpE [Desulfolithobacter dissulfuricans]BCO08141.1 protein GrpE [Desulfolithobacter dissulfuricans]